jgi:hypothetical protein
MCAPARKATTWSLYLRMDKLLFRIEGFDQRANP